VKLFLVKSRVIELKTYASQRPLQIDSKGLRRNAESINIIQRASQRLIDRYKFGATRINNVEILYKDGFTIEAGDIVAFDGGSIKLKDPQTGELLGTQLFEVVNKRLSIFKGSATVDFTQHCVRP
jgi:hypothetical protein